MDRLPGRADPRLLCHDREPHEGTTDYAEVLEVRAAHVAMVRDFLTTVTSEELATLGQNTWAPDRQESVFCCRT